MLEEAKNTRWLCVVSVALNIAEAKVVAASLYGPLPPTTSPLLPLPPPFATASSTVPTTEYSSPAYTPILSRFFTCRRIWVIRLLQNVETDSLLGCQRLNIISRQQSCFSFAEIFIIEYLGRSANRKGTRQSAVSHEIKAAHRNPGRRGKSRHAIKLSYLPPSNASRPFVGVESATHLTMNLRGHCLPKALRSADWARLELARTLAGPSS